MVLCSCSLSHLNFLENRILVFVEWTGASLPFKRGVRLITDRSGADIAVP